MLQTWYTVHLRDNLHCFQCFLFFIISNFWNDLIKFWRTERWLISFNTFAEDDSTHLRGLTTTWTSSSGGSSVIFWACQETPTHIQLRDWREGSVRAWDALPEDVSSALSIHSRQLTTTFNSMLQVIRYLCLLWVTARNVHTPIKTHTCKKVDLKKWNLFENSTHEGLCIILTLPYLSKLHHIRSQPAPAQSRACQAQTTNATHTLSILYVFATAVYMIFCLFLFLWLVG